MFTHLQFQDSWILVKNSFLPAINRTKLSAITMPDNETISFILDNGQIIQWKSNSNDIPKWYKELLQTLNNN